MNSSISVLSFKEFVKKIKQTISNDINSKYIFFLGAGCSASSDVPLAAELVRKWLSRLLEDKFGNKIQYSIDEIRSIIPQYEDSKESTYYSQVFELLFPSAEDRQKEIEQITEGKNPGFGYGILASLISDVNFGRNFNVILTVNFDDLIADALYLYTREKPLVILHECLTNFARILPKKPLVIKLHGDAKLEPKNVEDEIKELSEEYKGVMKKILSDSGLIFIGYGGNDKSISSILKELPEESLPLGLYWVGNHIPETEIGDFLIKRKAFHVKPRDFDELMLYFLEEFSLTLPDSRRYSVVLDDFYKKMNIMRNKIETSRENERRNEMEKIYITMTDEIVRGASSWHSIVIEASKWYSNDLQKANFIFSEGIKKFSFEPLLLGNYALFLHMHLKDYKKATEIYEKAILLTPFNAEILNNYATFIHKVLEDYTLMDKAEDMLLKALEIKPKDSSKLANYASFLHEVKRDYDKAEEFYLKALNANPEHVNNLGNYALFLVNVRENYELAEDLYRKAILIDPNHVIHISNFALYHINILQAYELAEELFERCFEKEPRNCGVLRKYAHYLWRIKGNMEEAEEVYRKIHEINPDDLYFNSTYAIFLIIEKEDYKAAEKFFKRALDLNPRNPEILDTYATFLCNVKSDYDTAEEYLKTALEMDANHPRLLNIYGLFLLKYRKNIAVAEKLFIKALEISPNDPYILSNFAYLCYLKQEFSKSEEFYSRSLEFDSKNANTSSNFAGLLLAKGDKKGFSYIEKAKLLPKNKENEGSILLEMNFYIIAHSTNEIEIQRSLEMVKKLLLKNIRSQDWDFSLNIKRAKEEKHQNIEFLENLASVISEKLTLDELDKFSIWNNIE